MSAVLPSRKKEARGVSRTNKPFEKNKPPIKKRPNKPRKKIKSTLILLFLDSFMSLQDCTCYLFMFPLRRYKNIVRHCSYSFHLKKVVKISRSEMSSKKISSAKKSKKIVRHAARCQQKQCDTQLAYLPGLL